jgi:enoyl-CoA hydratase/carnithine racemase
VRPVRVDVARSSDGGVATVRLPGGLLDTATAAELAATAHDLVEDRGTRVVVLSGPAGGFCTGAHPDLDRAGLGEDPASALARIRVPVVAAVEGACHSVGLELVLACDVVLAGPDATFRLADVADGGELPCWGGTQRLPRAIGGSRAAAMILLGGTLDALEARQAGLVWQVIEPTPDALAEATAAMTAKLRALGPLALEYAKEAVHRGAELPLRDGLRLEGDLNTLLATSEDRAEGLAAFFARRPADFAGR